MASSSSVRVRLHFDHATPGEARRRVWLLVDLDQCRVVADLEHVIRERFSLSARSVLNLFIDGCYLPPTESIRVVRDNDPVSVQVETLMLGGEVSGTSKKSKRRKKTAGGQEEEEESEPDLPGKEQEKHLKKKKKRKENTAGGQEEEESEPDLPGKEQEKHLKKKKKKRKENTAGGQDEEEESEPDLPGKEQEKHLKRKKRKKKKKKKEETPTSSRTPVTPSRQQVHKIPKPAVLNGPKPAVLNGPKPAVLNGPKPAVLNGPKPAVLKGKPEQASSSSSSGAEAPAAPDVASKVQKKTPRKAPAGPQGPLKAQPASGKRSQPRSSSSDSSSEETRGRTTSKPDAGAGAPPPQGRPPQGRPPQGRPPQGRPPQGRPPQGRPPSDSDSEEEVQLVIRRPLPRAGGEVPLDCRQEELPPCSVELQNPVDPPPRKDYSSLPLLAAPPGAGQKIVFKLLELTENYSPEVSEYKEGRVLHFDHATQQVEVELLSLWSAPAEPGKFDLVYQNADGSESVEYAVSRSRSRVTERWDSLLEPRLLL